MVMQVPSNFRTSILVPVGELELQDRQKYRDIVDNNLIAAAKDLAIRRMTSNFVIRDTLPGTDLGLATSEDWLVAGAGVAGTETQYINQVIALDQAMAFYALGFLGPNLPAISRVRLLLATSEVRAVFQTEIMELQLVPQGYFSEDVIYVRQETCNILVMPRFGGFAANTQRLHLGARTLEPLGPVVSAPSA